MCSFRLAILVSLAFASAVSAQPAVPPAASEPVQRSATLDFERPAGAGWSFSAGFDLMLVKPMFESNPAFVTQSLNPLAPGLTQSTRRIEEFDYALTANPRIWLALSDRSSGIGTRVRWFGFDQSASLETLNAPLPATQVGTTRLVSSMSPLLAIFSPTLLPGVNSIQTAGGIPIPDRLQFSTRFQMDLWDWDLTASDLKFGEHWLVTGFGGVRYLHLSQRYDASSIGLLPQTLESGHNFVGVGPSAGIEVRRSLPGTGLSAFGAFRYSVMMGTAVHSSSGAGLGLIPNPAMPGLSLHDDEATRKLVLPIIDLELGADWAQPIGSAEMFFRPAFVSMMLPKGSGSSGNGNMGVLGLSLSAGVRY